MLKIQHIINLFRYQQKCQMYSLPLSFRVHHCALFLISFMFVIYGVYVYL